jgi:very-short-patch-repair endonuclease
MEINLLKNFIICNLFNKSNKLNSSKLNKNWFINNNYIEYYNEIINITLFLNHDCKLSERIYCIFNNINNKKSCKTCKNDVKFLGLRYGYRKCCNDCVQKNIREKAIKTCLYKYGVNNPWKSQEIKNKIKQHNIKKYGVEYYFQSNDYKEKNKKTLIKKYGVSNINQVKEIRDKIKKTSLLKYGVDNPSKKLDLYYSKETIDKLNDIEFLKKLHYIEKKSIKEIAKEIGIAPSTMRLYFKKYNININNHYNSSIFEKEIIEFINIDNIILNNNSIIPPYELDIYLPDYKLAIEFDGIYWHKNKNKNYHLNKTNMCNQKGVELFHIFENEWIEKKDIWKSLINLKLKRNKIIYYNECILNNINEDTARDFINKNNILNYINSSINYGLLYNNELVCIMSMFDNKIVRLCYKNYYFIKEGYNHIFNNCFDKNISILLDKRFCINDIINELNLKEIEIIEPKFNKLWDCGIGIFKRFY